MIFALLLLGVLPMAVLPLLGAAGSEDDAGSGAGPGAGPDDDMTAGDQNETGAATVTGDIFDALRSDDSILAPDTADYLASHEDPGDLPGSDDADTGRDIFIDGGQGDTELADFIAGEDHLTLALTEGGTGEFTLGLAQDGTAAELSYQPLEGEGFTLIFAGHETVPLGDIDLVLSDPMTGETNAAALADLLLPAGGFEEAGAAADGDGGANAGNGAGGDANSSDDGDDGGEPAPDVLLPVIEPDLTGGGSGPGDVALAPVIAPDDPGPGGDEVALPPQNPDTVDAPVKGGHFDDDLEIYAGDIATGGGGQDTFWLWYDTDADVGYARITDFTPGEDMLRVTLSAEPGPVGYGIEVVATPDGLDARVLVNGEMVALLQDAPGASAADVFVDTGDGS